MPILIVEDDELTSHMLAVSLRKAGYRVNTAAGVAEAFQAFLREKPGIAIVDFNLPDGNGHQLAEQFWRHDSTQAIVLMSGSLPMEAADLRYAGCLEKPFRREELLVMIEQGLRADRRSATLSS